MRIAVLDIGGTAVKSGIWNGQELKEIRETPSEAKQGGSVLMQRMQAILKQLLPFEAIGISTAGQVNGETGSIIFANDNIPGYTGMEIRTILEHEFGVPAAVENDVNAAALGEMRKGAGIGKKDFLMLTYGTGIGGAIVTGGRLYHGASWSAGEFGGIVVHPEEMKDGQTFSGCYEGCGSASALVRSVQRKRPELSDGREIFGHLAEEDVKAAVDAWIDEVVCGLITLIHIFNPEMVILGGGIMSQSYVTDTIREKIRPKLAGGFQNTIITGAVLGNRAGMTGAAFLAETVLQEQKNKHQRENH